MHLAAVFLKAAIRNGTTYHSDCTATTIPEKNFLAALSFVPDETFGRPLHCVRWSKTETSTTLQNKFRSREGSLFVCLNGWLVDLCTEQVQVKKCCLRLHSAKKLRKESHLCPGT